jgi:hypothetical protein
MPGGRKKFMYVRFFTNIPWPGLDLIDRASRLTFFRKNT